MQTILKSYSNKYSFNKHLLKKQHTKKKATKNPNIEQPTLKFCGKKPKHISMVN